MALTLFLKSSFFRKKNKSHFRQNDYLKDFGICKKDGRHHFEILSKHNRFS